MHVPEKLKLNKFKLVAIPKKSDYFKRYGLNDIPMPTSEDEPVPQRGRKTENMRATEEDLKAWDKAKQKEADEGKE